jgi:hypothetical protein
MTARFSWNQRTTCGHILMPRAIALALRILMPRAIALALRRPCEEMFIVRCSIVVRHFSEAPSAQHL